VRGELLVEVLTDAPATVLAVGRRVFAERSSPVTHRSPAFTIASSRQTRSGWILRLEGVGDRREAERWRGRELLALAAELAVPGPDEVYVHEFAGMRVDTGDPDPPARVIGWYGVPQGIVLEIEGPRGRYDLPYNEAFVRGVDRASRTLYVSLPEGLPVVR
jgi:ribosomal 30S subunit maturation factor RimM